LAEVAVALAVFDEEDEAAAFGEGDLGAEDGVDAELAGAVVEADGAGEGIAVGEGGGGEGGGVSGFGDALRGECGIEEGEPAMGVEGSGEHSVSIYSIAQGGMG
jgi:hypothetical protein